jgi:flagellar basal body-associated protein FliL
MKKRHHTKKKKMNKKVISTVFIIVCILVVATITYVYFSDSKNIFIDQKREKIVPLSKEELEQVTKSLSAPQSTTTKPVPKEIVDSLTAKPSSNTNRDNGNETQNSITASKQDKETQDIIDSLSAPNK